MAGKEAANEVILISFKVCFFMKILTLVLFLHVIG